MTTLYDAIKAGVKEALRGLYIGMPGRLEAYDSATGRGQVKPLIMEPNQKGVLQALKPISGVPVVMPGGGSASLYLPPAVGDTGWISFSHRSMENWLDRGGDATPGDPRIMDMSDAVFWPGLRPFSAGSFAEESDALVLKNGEAKLKMRGGKLALGNAKTTLGSVELIETLGQLVSLLQLGSNGGGPVVFTPVGTNPTLPQILLKLQAIQGSL